MENPLGQRFFERLWELLVLNFLWGIACLPLVTVGAATAAAYEVAYQLQGDTKTYIARQFWQAFKHNVALGTLSQVIVLLLIGLSSFFLQLSVYFPTLAPYAQMLGVLIAALSLFLALLLFPIIGKFRLRLVDAVKNALYLLSRNTSSVIIVVATSVIGTTFALVLAPPLILIMGGLLIYLNSITLNAVFKKITAKE